MLQLNGCLGVLNVSYNKLKLLLNLVQLYVIVLDLVLML